MQAGGRTTQRNQRRTPWVCLYGFICVCVGGQGVRAYARICVCCVCLCVCTHVHALRLCAFVFECEGPCPHVHMPVVVCGPAVCLNPCWGSRNCFSERCVATRSLVSPPLTRTVFSLQSAVTQQAAGLDCLFRRKFGADGNWGSATRLSVWTVSWSGRTQASAC